MASRHKYRVAVIGCGSHGTRLARTFDLDPRCRVVCGANRGREGRDLFCERFGGLPGYQDYRQLLAEEEFEIALLALPVSVNPEVVAACAGKEGVAGIFSEKPVAVSLAEADGAVEACAARGIPWSAGDMFRNAPEIWTARRLVESGEIGEVQSIDIYGCGGNQMSGQGCRQLSDGFMFAGDAEVDWVVGAVDGDPADAHLGRIDEHSDHDQGVAFGVLGFANGLIAHLHRNVSAKNGIEVLGSDGVLFIGQSRVGEIWRRDGRHLKPARSLFPHPDPGQAALHQYDEEGWEIPRTRMSDSVAAFLDAVESGVSAKCSGADMRKALEVAVAIRESHRRGVVRVDLPLQDRSLRIIPSLRRYLGRRESEGTGAFLAHIRAHKRDQTSETDP